MVIRKALVALATAGLVLGSTAAAAAPVAVDGARDGSPVGASENLNFAWIIAILILIGVIGVIAADGSEDLPQSP
jgi:CRISPR/Cas system-associated exonuclease Cas4 (RecB family)